MADIRKIAFEVKWRIENVTFWFQTRDDPLYSPQFLASTLMNTRWKLSLSTNWQLNEKYLSLTVHRDVEDNGPEFISLNYELAFLASDDSQAITKLCKSRFAEKTEGNKLCVKCEIFKHGSEAYLPENVMTISCQFWYAWPKVSKSEQYLIRSVIGRKCITLDGLIYHYHWLSQGTRHFLNFSSPSSDISFISFWIDENKKFKMVFETKNVDCKRFTRYNCKLYFLDEIGVTMASYNMKNPETSLALGNQYEFELCISANSFTNFTENADTLLLQLEIAYFPGIESESIEHDFNKTSVKTIDGESTGTKDMDPSSENPNNISQQGDEKDFTKVTGFEETGSINDADCFDVDGSIYSAMTTIKTDLTSLYNDRLFCDTKLQTDTETFPAHRCVLSARSPVFKKMFTTDMKEAMGEGINISDISADTVCKMLQFLYTDCIGDLDMQSAKDLYIVSDKYDIVSLKQLCFSFMKDNLCPANVCEVLVLADMHQDKDLESAANEYIMNYDEEVFSSEEWMVFMQNYSSLAARVMFMKIRNK